MLKRPDWIKIGQQEIRMLVTARDRNRDDFDIQKLRYRKIIRPMLMLTDHILDTLLTFSSYMEPLIFWATFSLLNRRFSGYENKSLLSLP